MATGPTRNGVLARGMLEAAGFTLLATVPPGRSWLLKSVLVYSAATTAGKVLVQLNAADGTATVRLPAWQLDPDAEAEWQGETAVGPGDLVVAYVEQAPVHVWVFGADLPGALVPQEPSTFMPLPAGQPTLS